MEAAGVPTAGRARAGPRPRSRPRSTPSGRRTWSGRRARRQQGRRGDQDRAEALAHAALCLSTRGRPGGGRGSSSTAPNSVFAVCDGDDGVRPPAGAGLRKRIFDGGRGPSTGRMGFHSPLAWAQDDLADVVLDQVVRPTLACCASAVRRSSVLVAAGLALTRQAPRHRVQRALRRPRRQPVLAVLASPNSASCCWRPRAGRPQACLARFAGRCRRQRRGRRQLRTPRRSTVIAGSATPDAMRRADVVHAGTSGRRRPAGHRAAGSWPCARSAPTSRRRARAYAAADLITFPASSGAARHRRRAARCRGGRLGRRPLNRVPSRLNRGSVGRVATSGQVDGAVSDSTDGTLDSTVRAGVGGWGP